MPRPDALVLLSPAIAVAPAVAFAVWQARLASVPGLHKLAWNDILPEFDPYKYNSFATNAGALVHRGTRSVAQRVRERSGSDPGNDLPPILVLKSTVDATVSNTALVDRLLGRLAPDRHELVLFDINRSAAEGPLRVEPHLFALLEHAARLFQETHGAFDLTSTPLSRSIFGRSSSSST